MITSIQTAIDDIEQARETLWGKSRGTGWGWSELDDATLDNARDRLKNAVSAHSAWCSRECPAIDSAPLHKLDRAVAAWDGCEFSSWEDPSRGTTPWMAVKQASAEADVVLDKILAASDGGQSAAGSKVTLNSMEVEIVQAGGHASRQSFAFFG